MLVREEESRKRTALEAKVPLSGSTCSFCNSLLARQNLALDQAWGLAQAKGPGLAKDLGRARGLDCCHLAGVGLDPPLQLVLCLS